MRILLIWLISITLLGCKSKIDELFPPPAPVQLPPETQVGANTFGCVLNSQIWEGTSHGSIRPFVYSSPDASYSRGDLILSASARTESHSPIGNFWIYVGGIRRPGVYPLGKAPRRNAGDYGYAEVGSDYPLTIYATDSLRIGTITVTRLDTVSAKKFISGRFELMARPKNGGAVTAGLPAEIVAMQGRFDVMLNRP